MIASHLLHSTLECQEKKSVSMFQHAASSLFPRLSFGLEERSAKETLQKRADEIVWIEGTVTVSF